jgi:hypothetical protein
LRQLKFPSTAFRALLIESTILLLLLPCHRTEGLGDGRRQIALAYGVVISFILLLSILLPSFFPSQQPLVPLVVAIVLARYAADNVKQSALCVPV